MNEHIKDHKILLSFDLDNTLINNREGIVNSFNYALKKYKLPTLETVRVEEMIGIPLIEMFKQVSNVNPKKLVKAFRSYYGKKGIYQGNLLPDVKLKLEELKRNSFTLGVITSKKQEMAIRIVQILGIFDFFEYVIGESKQIKSKLDPNLKISLLDKYKGYKIVIIGDHPKDKALAENLNVPFVGVLSGNHSAEELQRGSTVKTLIIKSIKDLKPELIYSLF
ncbi:MAG: HAD hydrolase-like protein [Candidatus Lokiarchaeota archaeon]|nr:HAD hydrolase-like protein [Candidatus Lokiarchaeota archaeon]